MNWTTLLFRPIGLVRWDQSSQSSRVAADGAARCGTRQEKFFFEAFQAQA